MPDPYNLVRFLNAQDPVLAQVRTELRAGRKRNHWMWFVFPQLVGLGFSEMAQRYAITSLAEAQSYLAHLVLGPRLIECTALVNAVEDRSVHQIFDSPDDLKFHSSMTLFALAEPNQRVFSFALQKYFGNILDKRTIEAISTL